MNAKNAKTILFAFEIETTEIIFLPNGWKTKLSLLFKIQRKISFESHELIATR